MLGDSAPGGFCVRTTQDPPLGQLPESPRAREPEGAAHHPVRVVAKLAGRDRHHVQALSLQGGDLQPIPLEGEPARVGVVAVDLDGEVELPPQDVHLEAVDSPVQLVAGEACLAKQAKHSPLGRRAGATRAAGKVEDGAQRCVAALAGVAFELLLEAPVRSPAAGSSASATSRSRSSEPSSPARSRIVRGGLVRGIPLPVADVRARHIGPMDPDAGPRGAPPGRNGDAGRGGGWVGEQVPERRGASVAEDRVWAAREQRGHVATVLRRHRVADEVDAAMSFVEPLASKPQSDLSRPSRLHPAVAASPRPRAGGLRASRSPGPRVE